MKSCWIFMPEERPSFTTLVKKIHQEIQMSEYLEPANTEQQGSINDPYVQMS